MGSPWVVRLYTPVGAMFLTLLWMAWTLAPASAHQRVPSNELDPTFGEGGVVITDPSSPDEFIQDLSLQADGRIVALGSTFSRFVVLRYSPSGDLDSTFSITNHPFGVALAVQPDQKVVVAGTVSMRLRFGLDRMNADGTIDRTFGRDGRTITRFPVDVNLEDVTVQPDGKIVAAGQAIGPGEKGYVVARYLPDGSLDRSFGSGGTVHIALTSEQHKLGGIAIQEDDKIVANGSVSSVFPSRLGIVRLEQDGSLDPTFGDGGKVITTEFGFSATALALQPDGDILSGGQNVGQFSTEFGVVRHRPDGTLDTTFGDGGLAHVVFNGLSEDPRDLAVQPGGLIVQAGSSPDEGDENDLAVAWYENDGSIHSQMNTPLLGFSSAGYAVVAQPDGKAIVAGGGGSGFDDTRLGMARFLSS